PSSTLVPCTTLFRSLLTRALVGAIDGDPVGAILPFVAAAAGVVVLRAVLVALADHVSARGAARASLQLRSALVDAVGRKGPGWLDRKSTRLNSSHVK